MTAKPPREARRPEEMEMTAKPPREARRPEESRRWEDRDLLPWARRTLPEALRWSLRGPQGGAPALTPWERLEVTVVEADIDGEIGICGKVNEAYLEMDLNVGLRLAVRRRLDEGGGWPGPGGDDDGGPGEGHAWFAVVQLLHLEASSGPELALSLADVPEAYADEVAWFLRQGPGCRGLWRALADWRAAAFRTWLHREPPDLEGPPPEPRPAGFFEEALAFGQEEDESLLLLRPEPVEASPDASAAQEEETIRRPEFLEGTPGAPAADTPAAAPAAPAEPALAPSRAGPPRQGAAASSGSGHWRACPWLPSLVAGVAGPSANWRCQEDGAPETLEGRGRHRASGTSTSSKTAPDAAGAATEGQARARELRQAISQEDIVRVFTALDAESANCPDGETGRCALHWCVLHRSADLLRLILASRADVNLKDESGRTCLMLAAQQGNAELSKLLLDAGARASEQDDRGLSATDLVSRLPPEREAEEVRSLLQASERPRRLREHLFQAIREKDARTAEAAIEAGGDVNIAGERSDTPLLLIAKGKWRGDEAAQIRLAEKCLQAGAAVDARNDQGHTALQFASHRGNLGLVNALLRLRAAPGTANDEGNTALMYAAHGGFEGVCSALLDAGSPAGCLNKFGLTAAEMALKKGHQRCAVLVQAHELAPKQLSDCPEVRERETEAAQPPPPDVSQWSPLERLIAAEAPPGKAEAEAGSSGLIAGPPRQRAPPAAAEAEAAAVAPWEEDFAALTALGGSGRPVQAPLAPERPAARPPAERKVGDIDFCRWERLVDEADRREEELERREHLERNPEYVWRNGARMRVML